MSPTATPENDESSAEIGRLQQALIEHGLAAPSEIVGCTEDQVDEVVSAAHKFPLPDAYITFLRVMGRSAGRLLEGTHAFYPSLLNAARAAASIAEDPDEELKLADRFFFAHHQGYVVCFFEKGSPAVYCYEEGQPPARKLADSFPAWLRNEYDGVIEVQQRAEKPGMDRSE